MKRSRHLRDADKKKPKNDYVHEAEPEELSDETDPVDESAPVTESSSDDTLREHQAEERRYSRNEKKLKKIIKKKEKRESRSKREVLSYEDMPLEERASSAPKKGFRLNKKRIILAAVVVAVVTLIVFAVVNSDKLSFNNIKNFIEYGIFNKDSEERFPINIQGENISDGNFIRMGQNLCFASETRICTVNNYGKITFSAQNGQSVPVLKAANNLSILYNLGGTGFQINAADKEVYTSTAEGNIFAADIVDNGIYALVTQADGYLAKLYVYNQENEKLFSYSFADYYITSVSLNSHGSQAVLSGVSALNGAEVSAIYVLDFTRAEPLVLKEIEDNIIYEVDYLNDSYACVIGNHSAMSMKVSNGDINETAYDGRTLTAYTVNDDTNTYALSLSRSGDGRNCDILNFSTNGALSSTITTELRIISLSTYKNRVAALSADVVYLYRKDGHLISSVEAGIDPHAVVLYTKDDAYILGTSEISGIHL